jgi:hypothetical protein
MQTNADSVTANNANNIPRYVSVLCRSKLSGVFFLAWRQSARRLILRRLKALSTKVSKCKTSNDLASIFGPPRYEMPGCESISSEGLQWLRSVDPKRMEVWDEIVLPDSDAAAIVKADPRKVQMVAHLFDEARKAGLVNRVEKMVVYQKGSCEFVFDVNGEEIVGAQYKGPIFNPWDAALGLETSACRPN